MKHREAHRPVITTITLVLVTTALATTALATDPPVVSDAEVDARLAEHRREMDRRHERERIREERTAAERDAERRYRGHVEAQWGRRIQADEESLAGQAGLGDFDFDHTAVSASDFRSGSNDISLAMFHDPEAEKPAEGGGGGEDLAAQATNPIASLVQLQFQNTFVGEHNAGDGVSNTFVVQPVIPWKLGDLTMITRLTLPLLVATPDFDDPIGREYGLGDLVALNAMVFNIKDGFWKGMIAPIATVTIPTASSDFTGQGKWQAGPGGLYINLANPKLQWGIMAYQQWSFASSGGDDDRQEVSTLFFQPIVTRHFEKGWYLSTQDILWSYDFKNDVWSLPVGFRLGKVTKLGNQPLNVFIEPFYDVSTNNPGNEWGFKINVTMLFPQ